MSIVGLERDRDQHGKPLYEDEDCATRALAYHRGVQAGDDGYLGLTKRTTRLKELWQTDGLMIQDIPCFEKIFHINVGVFQRMR